MRCLFKRRIKDLVPPWQSSFVFTQIGTSTCLLVPVFHNRTSSAKMTLSMCRKTHKPQQNKHPALPLIGDIASRDLSFSIVISVYVLPVKCVFHLHKKTLITLKTSYTLLAASPMPKIHFLLLNDLYRNIKWTLYVYYLYPNVRW